MSVPFPSSLVSWARRILPATFRFLGPHNATSRRTNKQTDRQTSPLVVRLPNAEASTSVSLVTFAHEFNSHLLLLRCTLFLLLMLLHKVDDEVSERVTLKSRWRKVFPLFARSLAQNSHRHLLLLLLTEPKGHASKLMSGHLLLLLFSINNKWSALEKTEKEKAR